MVEVDHGLEGDVAPLQECLDLFEEQGADPFGAGDAVTGAAEDVRVKVDHDRGWLAPRLRLLGLRLVGLRLVGLVGAAEQAERGGGVGEQLGGFGTELVDRLDVVVGVVGGGMFGGEELGEVVDGLVDVLGAGCGESQGEGLDVGFGGELVDAVAGSFAT
ncbi:hypothetical protein ACFQ3F_23255 [Nocardioides ginsengisoli]|uniref:Uncharacterized protein n=1 Tax=Nocardioides ginsengisoli TaxID=363868 RepID=A0ABW3W901_9ACTN